MPLDPWIVDKRKEGKYTHEVWWWIPNISWISNIIKDSLLDDHPQDFMVPSRAMWDLSWMWTLLRLSEARAPHGSYKLLFTQQLAVSHDPSLQPGRQSPPIPRGVLGKHPPSSTLSPGLFRARSHDVPIYASASRNTVFWEKQALFGVAGEFGHSL